MAQRVAYHRRCSMPLYEIQNALLSQTAALSISRASPRLLGAQPHLIETSTGIKLIISYPFSFS
jgi:hypothetical protein